MGFSVLLAFLVIIFQIIAIIGDIQIICDTFKVHFAAVTNVQRENGSVFYFSRIVFNSYFFHIKGLGSILSKY